jgi:hypothetical protein
MIELPESDAYQGRRYSTDSEDPGWGTWLTLSVDEVDHWKNLISAGYKREVRELIATDQLRTYGDQRAAEAREQMREECVKELQGMTTNNATARSAIKQCAEALKELK